MNQFPPRERKLLFRYLGEMVGVFFLYAAVLIASIEIANRLHKGPVQTAVVLTPMIPFLLILAVIVRHVRRLDEYVRLQMLENVVIVAGVTAGLAFTYGFLEGVGYPRLSMFTVWPVMCAAFVVVSFGRVLLRR
jgi:hypothetical protein